MKATFGVLAALLLAGCASIRSTDDIPVVKNFDASRYVGIWHEIARLPDGREKGLVNVSANWTQDGDGFDINSRGWRGENMRVTKGVAHFAGAKDEGALRVSFFLPMYDDYRIIWISPEYDLAMVTSSSRSHLWFFARKSKVAPEKLDSMIKQAKEWGFETEALEFPQ